MFFRGGQDSLESEGNDTTSDSELQSSDSQDDTADDSEDDARSDNSEIDGFVEHGCQVLFLPSLTLKALQYKANIESAGALKLLK